MLAALLVFSQAALLIHRSDVDAHVHGEHCDVCLLVHGLDNAAPNTFVLHIDKVEPPQFAATHARTCVRRTSVFYATRAPPPYTHLS
jgi:radical SAM superfamily enzyme with C-terminal helix-hairpin-helix motif